MTVAQLIELLKTVPQDFRIMTNAGEWGPQPVESLTIEITRNGEGCHWIEYYPELEDSEDDRPRETVALLHYTLK